MLCFSVLPVLLLCDFAVGTEERASNMMLIEMHEEMLEDALELDHGTFRLLAKISSRGSTQDALELLAIACQRTNADLSPWADMLETYGVFQNGKAIPEDPTKGIDATLL